MIDQRLQTAKKSIDDNLKESDNLKFVGGWVYALSELKKFLTDNLNSKLPKKIRKQFKVK